MSMLSLTHAETVVRMVISHKPWNLAVSLGGIEISLLLDLVRRAGFDDCASIEKKQLLGKYDDTERTYPINTVCSYSVLRSDGEPHVVATIWLDSLVKEVQYYKESQEPSLGLVRHLVDWFEKTKCFIPVQLTEEGELLGEYPKQSPLDHTVDEDPLVSCVGIHVSFCHGWVDRKQVSSTHDVLLCRSCGLRVYIPKGIVTWGDLRKHCAAKLARAAMEK